MIIENNETKSSSTCKKFSTRSSVLELELQTQ